MTSDDGTNQGSNNGDCSKPIAETRNIRVAQEKRIDNIEASIEVMDPNAGIGFQKDSKLKASLYPSIDENKFADMDADVEHGIASVAIGKDKTEARISSSPSPSTASYSKTEYATAFQNNGNESKNDAYSDLDSDSISKERENVLRTTPGAFAINNPLSSSFGNRPLLEQRPSLRNFTSSMINSGSGSHVLENLSTQGSNQPQDVLDDPETTNASVVAAAATPCLSAIRVGNEFEVYEGQIVGDEEDENEKTNLSKQKTTFFAASCVMLWMAFVIIYTFRDQQLDGIGNNNTFEEAEHSHGTTNESPSGTIKVPSGAMITNSPDPESKQLRDYLLSVLAPISGPAGAQVFDRSGTDTSMDRISALGWMVDDLTGIIVFEEDSSSPRVSIPEWKILQRYVLALTYFATVGAGWDIRAQFLSKEHECSWNEPTPLEWILEDEVLKSSNEAIGVSCNEAGFVEGLKLRWNDLSGTLPHELSYFKDTLEELDLGGGSISGTIPSSFTDLTKLKTLGLNDNCLSGTIPEGLSTELPLLERFNIVNNGDLYGSLNGFCNDNKYAKEGILAVATECPLPLAIGDDGLQHMSDNYVGVECDCCICCDRDDYDCYDRQSGRSWKSYNLNAKMNVVGLVKQFGRGKECRTEANIEWIREKCPWYTTVDKNNTNTDVTDINETPPSFECAVDDSKEGSRGSFDPWYWY